MLRILVLLVCVVGCAGEEFNDTGFSEVGGAGSAGIAGAAGQSGTATAGAGAGPAQGGSISLGGSSVGAGGGRAGGAQGGITSTGGGGGMSSGGAAGNTATGGGGGGLSTCPVPDLTNKLPTSFAWQEFHLQQGDWCGKCRDTPCHTLQLSWRYPLDKVDDQTFHTLLEVTSSLASFTAGPCAGPQGSCASSGGGNGQVDIHFVRTATGWKIDSIRQHFSDPTLPDESFMGYLPPVTCSDGGSWPDHTTIIRDDVYVDFKAAMIGLSFPCP